ncbi:Peroxidase 1 [Triticum urartu]|uniref:Peroxidase n=1 Tax=Triticum urartu TaxID=4572 RepID=M7ZFY1_TRIUA|nr:Peroxidase 1 [Triticum urartu]
MSSLSMKCMLFTSAVTVALALFPVATVGAGLKVGFYSKSCPSAENLVQQAVAAAFKNNTGVAAGLIRLHFHDCFVKGCDGSVLIDSTANNTAEKDAPPNKPSLRGFEVIDTAKKAIEAKCPKTVSCADILAFAARDSIALAGNVPPTNLPSPLSTAAELVGNFTLKNLTAEDMVVLSGAHTIGVSRCSSFTNRLYAFSNTSQLGLRLPAGICPANSSQFFPTTTTDMDIITPTLLDNKYYVGLTNNLGLFTSDQALLTNSTLKASVDAFVKSEKSWKSKFVKSMVKMGDIEVLTGTQGEIRLSCRVINKGSAGLEINDGPDSAEFAGIATS